MGKTAKILPIIAFILIWLIFSWQFFLKGLVPAPLDMLVNFYGPWESYQVFPIKNPAIPDIVTQIIPWKIYTIAQLKLGIIPLWNPFNFSGAPHLANFQSAVFSPINLLFFGFSFINAWSLLILLQPLLAGIFTIFYCRKIGLKNFSSFLSGLSFAFCGFLTVWLEYGTLGWAILWLPLTFLLWEYFWETKKWLYWTLINIAISFSLLSGHLQISLYLILANVLYCGFAFWQKKFKGKYLFVCLTAFIFPFLLTAFQFLPTLEYYFLSPRSGQIPIDWFKGLQIPFVQLITFFFPDFFGHPVTRNQWAGGSYVEMMGYIGFLSMVMVIFYFFYQAKKGFFSRKNKGLFFAGLLFFSLILALPTFFSNAIVWSKMPILSSSAPSRIIYLISFSLAILAGFGWELFEKKIREGAGSILAVLFIIAVCLAIIFPIAYKTNEIAFRNILFPSAIFAIFFVVSFLFLKWNLLKKAIDKKFLFAIYCLIFILLVSFDLFRFSNKFLPFSEKKDFYPQMEVINFLKQNIGYCRIYGLLNDNLNLPFNLYTTSGYDSLNIINYQQLINASQDSLADLPKRVTGEQIQTKGKYSKKLLDKLGVKYVVVGKSDVFGFPTWDYPQSFDLVWEDKNYFIYENKDIWPRFFLTQNYKLADKENSLEETLKISQQQIILIEDPQIQINETIGRPITPEIYQPEKIVFKTKSNKESLLFLSDTYYPGWQASVDGKKTSIFKANYSFRAVKVPKGNHQIEFLYKPKSFALGIKISIIAFLIVIFIPLSDKLFLRKEE